MKKVIRKIDITWYLLGFSWILSLVFGLVGFDDYSDIHNLGFTFWDNLYFTFQLFPLNSGGLEPPTPLLLNIARFLAPVLAGAAAIKALWLLFRKQIQIARISTLQNHMIICGLSYKGWLLANQFQKEKVPVVIIERNNENKYLDGCQKPGIYVIGKDATDPATLEKAGLNHAHSIFAVCGDDGVNVEIALRAQALKQKKDGQSLSCFVHVSDPQLCQILNKKIASLEKSSFHMELFNVYERGARRLLQKFPAWDEESITSPQIIVLGLGEFGQNLVLQIGRSWWNFQNDKKHKFEIIVIDRNARQNVSLLFSRYPMLKSVVDIVPLNIEVNSAEFELAEYLTNGLPDRIYICLDNDSTALKAGLTLHQITNEKVPIIIRMLESGGLERLMQAQKNSIEKTNLIPFLVLKEVCNANLLKEQPRDFLAQAFHESYIQDQIANSQYSNNNLAMVPWENLSSTYKTKNYQQVDHLLELANEFGFIVTSLVDWSAPFFEFQNEIIESMAQREHELWLADCLKEGWRYRSGDKDLLSKTNPAIIDWKDLPEQERQKNRDFIQHIPKLLGKAGFQIIKK